MSWIPLGNSDAGLSRRSAAAGGSARRLEGVPALCWLGVLIFAAAVYAVSGVKFPEDFRSYAVGDVLVLEAPRAECPVIEVHHDRLWLGRYIASLLNATPRPGGAGIAEVLREAAEAAGGRVLATGVVSAVPPAGYVATTPLNVTEFAKRTRGIKTLLVILPWQEGWVKEYGGLKIWAVDSIFEVLEREFKKIYDFLKAKALERARAFRKWLEGDSGALDEDAKRAMMGFFVTADGLRPVELNESELRRAVRCQLEVLLGKPVEKASDEDLARMLPYFIGKPQLLLGVNFKDAYFGLPSISVPYVEGVNATFNETREAALRALSVLNCTPAVLYIYNGSLMLYFHLPAYRYPPQCGAEEPAHADITVGRHTKATNMEVATLALASFAASLIVTTARRRAAP